MQTKCWGTLLLGLALLTPACGGGGGLGRPVAQFPSREGLAALTKESAKPTLTLETKEVERWQIQTPVPPAGTEFRAENTWGRLLIEQQQQSSGKLQASAALSCAAQESARFYVENGAYPGDGLQRYLLARCGSTLANAGLAAVGGAIPDSTTDEQIEKGYLPQVRGLLPQQSRQADLGIGFARGQGRAAVVIYSGVALGRLEGFSPLVSGNSIELRGEAARDAQFVLGLVNHGAYGIRFCEPNRAVWAPRFHLTCPLDPNDAQARIEIVSRKAGQVLTRQSLAVLVRRSEEAGLLYEANTYGNAASVSGSAEFRAQLVESLNTARRAASLQPLALETNQSQMNERFAPHLFQAMFSSDEERAETLALGALAGWDVSGTIRNGGVLSGYLATTRSPGLYLSHALESPLGRWVLLDPQMSRVAVGASPLGSSGVLALVTAYAFFDSDDHRSDENAVFEELSKVRTARGLPAPTRVPRGAEMTAALAKVATHALTTEEAMQEALTQISATSQQAVAGWVVETSDLKQLPLSDELLAPGPLSVTVGVTHYRAEGAAWGQYVVLFAAPQSAPPPTKTATVRARRAAF